LAFQITEWQRQALLLTQPYWEFLLAFVQISALEEGIDLSLDVMTVACDLQEEEKQLTELLELADFWSLNSLTEFHRFPGPDKLK
jgi:hypothetical protein